MDEDDKVRRNLVVFSGAVLVTNYLDISISKLATENFKLGDVPLDPYRVLCLSLVILVYLAVRYRFSEEGIKYSKTLKSEWETLCVERTQRWSRLAVMLYLKRGTELRGVFPADVADILKATSAAAYQANDGVLPDISDLTIGNSSAGPKPWIYTAFMRFQWTAISSEKPLSTEGTVDIHFSGLPLLALKVTTTLQTWFYSKASIHALVPAVVGSLAGITLLIRVWRLSPQ